MKTQFTIALPNTVKTRMAADNVQKDGNFLGIKNIKLIPFTTKPTAGTEALNGSIVELSNITALEKGNNSKVYNDVAINTGTKFFLFYGQANVDDGFDHGQLATPAAADITKPSDVTFTPVQILTATGVCGGSTKGQAVITLLNKVAQTTGWSTASNVKLKNFYDKFIKLEAGSSEAAKETLEDLYNSLTSFATGTEGVIQADLDLAAAIKANITDGGCTVSGTTLTLPSGAQGYPEDLNMPKGAARVVWDTDKFVDNSSNANAAINNVASLQSYVYPASLQYYVNSALKAADQKMTNDQNKYTQSSWTDVIAAYTAAAAGDVVKATTRSIAIIDQIQYGVGRLDATVAQLPSKLYDHDGTEVSATNGYTLTAVIIGGQKQVDWKFEQNAAATEYTIYDKAVSTQSAITATTASAPNYTLALQNKENEPVNVALEFTNNGEDFVGKDGQIIPAGSTFYLVAALNPAGENSDKKITYVFKQDYMTVANFSIKPGKSATELTGEEKNEEGLGSATNTIPDLRTPKLELGLSVNLTWEQGLTFNVGL